MNNFETRRKIWDRKEVIEKAVKDFFGMIKIKYKYVYMCFYEYLGKKNGIGRAEIILNTPIEKVDLTTIEDYIREQWQKESKVILTNWKFICKKRR